MTVYKHKEVLAAMKKRGEEHPCQAEAWHDLAQTKMMGRDANGGDGSTKRGITLIEILILLVIFGVLAFVVKGCFFAGSSNKPAPKQSSSSSGLVRITTQPQFEGNFVIRTA